MQSHLHQSHGNFLGDVYKRAQLDRKRGAGKNMRPGAEARSAEIRITLHALAMQVEARSSSREGMP